MSKRLILLISLIFPLAAFSEDTPLRPDYRAIPGTTPTPWLKFLDPAATSVVVAGSWDGWSGRFPMQLVDGVWSLDTHTLPAEFGNHEFKFIANDNWEKGDNRSFYINGDHLLDQPSKLIFSAAVDDRNEITVTFRHGVPENAKVNVRLVPEVPIQKVHFADGREAGRLQGYFIAGGLITFVFDAATYGVELGSKDRVTVAGNFNGWDSSGGGGRWILSRPADGGPPELTIQLGGLRPPQGENDLLFKFVIIPPQGSTVPSRWLAPPQGAVNTVKDSNGNANFKIDPASAGGNSLKIVTANPLDLSQPYVVVIDGIQEQPIWSLVTPGKIFDRLKSDKPLGAILDREHGCTTYRLFAPRASRVTFCLFDSPQYEVWKPEHRKIEPVERYPMWQDTTDGVWEISLLGLDIGKYYSFNVDGSIGNGEGFNGQAQIGDPYARAAAHSMGNSIVIDPDETNRWWSGWTDQDYAACLPQDIVLYEMHVRDLTMHPSSGVTGALAGKYEGLIATDGLGTGLDHIRDLGITTVEILPPAEFSNGEDEYDWGYAPVFYFAPEASYARRPLKGSQYFEFKRLINELHRLGLGVVLDVVFNHVGGPNIFHMIDKKYYFRLNPDYTYSNFSGCGNDVRTEAPMMRRLIVDNIVYWMKEFHVDGFRFDLAELIDLDTMMQLRDAARAINTNVVLISEPWSFRGENKPQLKGTGWSAWNNDFRYASKDFVMGRRNREWLQKNIMGSVDTWAANPLQPVNYLASHDDMALADELCTLPNRDGRSLQEMDVAVNRVAATILFTSLGIPMISEGEEFIRSKWGFHNTFDKNDDVNAIRWTDRDRPVAAQALAYYKGLIHLRLSDAGKSFRVTDRPPADYYRWIMPAEEQTLGYIVNEPKIHEGAGFIVLLNVCGGTQVFNVPLPAGRWRLIGDGVKIDPAGIPDTQVVEGPKEMPVQVAGLRAYIFMNGF